MRWLVFAVCVCGLERCLGQVPSQTLDAPLDETPWASPETDIVHEGASFFGDLSQPSEEISIQPKA